MRSIVAWCLTLALFSFLPLTTGQAPGPQPASLAVGPVTIAAIKGEVAIRALDGASLPSLRGQVLQPGTVIETKKGSVVLDLIDGSQAQVKGNTRVVVKDPTRDQYFSLELFLGKVITKIKKRLGAEPGFRMGTPTAVITVRGTEFLTNVDKKGKTEVFVYEGVVQVQGILPGSRPVFVRPGFWTTVEPHRPPRPPAPMDLSNPMTRASGDDDRFGTGAGDPAESGSSSDRTGRTDSGEREPQTSQPSSSQKDD